MGRLARLAAALLSLLVVLEAPLPAAAQERIYVRNHRGFKVFVEPLGRQDNMILVKEIYQVEGRNATVNSFYGYDCNTRSLRHIDLDDKDIVKDDDFYSGSYKTAHDKFCAAYKDPLD